MTQNINHLEGDTPIKPHKDSGFMGHPKPLQPLFFTEMWERFSYYSIRPLLVLFMVATIQSGGFGFDDVTASAIYGIFAGAMYLMAVPGGWLADNWLGQERALWWGSLIIALGHLCIALSAMVGASVFFLGLMFIVIGSGLFKTCISVMVGHYILTVMAVVMLGLRYFIWVLTLGRCLRL